MIKKIFKMVLPILLSGVSFVMYAGERNLTFAYMSDVHITLDSDVPENTLKCIEDINANDDIAFVIFAGDITDFGSDREILKAKSIFDRLEKPYYILAGNHDAKWSESGCNTFSKVFGYEHFCFDAAGIRFIGCNSGPNMRMAPALVPRESILWLEEVIAGTDPLQPVVFINHYPMDEQVLNYFEVIDILKRSNVQLMMCGHGHANRPLDFEGIPAVMGRSSLPAKTDGPGYNIVTIDGSIISFRERIAGGETKRPWYSVRMSQGKAFDDGRVYERPDSSVNDQYPQVSTLWRIQDNTDIGSGAVLAGKYVVYANTAGIVKAVNASNGSPVWSFATEGKIFSTPAVSGNYVLVGSTDNGMYCLDLRSGRRIWRYECDKSVLSSPTVYGGKVYFGASDNRFRCLDLKTGRLLWANDEIEGFVEAKAYVDNQQVVVGDWAGKLYSMDPATGRTQWVWTNKKGRMYSPAAVWPVKSDDRIYIVTPERVTYALRASTGYQIWKVKGGRESIGLSPDKDMLFIKTMQDTVMAVAADIDQLRVKWVSNTGFGYEISPTPITSVKTGKGQGIVFVPTDKGNIIALNMADGKIIWKHRVSFALVNYILPIGKDRLLVSTMDGVVTMLKYR